VYIKAKKKKVTYQARSKNLKRPTQTSTGRWVVHYRSSESLRNPTEPWEWTQWCSPLSRSLKTTPEANTHYRFIFESVIGTVKMRAEKEANEPAESTWTWEERLATQAEVALTSSMTLRSWGAECGVGMNPNERVWKSNKYIG